MTSLLGTFLESAQHLARTKPCLRNPFGLALKVLKGSQGISTMFGGSPLILRQSQMSLFGKRTKQRQALCSLRSAVRGAMWAPEGLRGVALAGGGRQGWISCGYARGNYSCLLSQKRKHQRSWCMHPHGKLCALTRLKFKPSCFLKTSRPCAEARSLRASELHVPREAFVHTAMCAPALACARLFRQACYRVALRRVPPRRSKVAPLLQPGLQFRLNRSEFALQL